MSFSWEGFSRADMVLVLFGETVSAPEAGALFARLLALSSLVPDVTLSEGELFKKLSVLRKDLLKSAFLNSEVLNSDGLNSGFLSRNFLLKSTLALKLYVLVLLLKLEKDERLYVDELKELLEGAVFSFFTLASVFSFDSSSIS